MEPVSMNNDGRRDGRFEAACQALFRIWGPVLRDNPTLTVEEAMNIPGGREAYRRIVRAFWLEDADADDSAFDSELDALCETLVEMVLAGLEVPSAEPVLP